MNLDNYHPIALTSCLCITMEHMISNRLIWFLVSKEVITNLQSGFCKKNGTIYHLVHQENFIREAFIKKEHLTAIFFDLEKAYDLIWKNGIMRDLHNMAQRVRLPGFLSNFLFDRNFKVYVGFILSNLHNKEEGILQCSIIVVILFSIKINSILKCLNPGID